METATAPLPDRRMDNNEKNRIVAKIKSESEVLKLFNELTIQLEEQKKRAADLIVDNEIGKSRSYSFFSTILMCRSSSCFAST
jgi:hypothetical protein